jgi:hypothetical protein
MFLLLYQQLHFPAQAFSKPHEPNEFVNEHGPSVAQPAAMHLQPVPPAHGADLVEVKHLPHPQSLSTLHSYESVSMVASASTQDFAEHTAPMSDFPSIDWQSDVDAQGLPRNEEYCG